MAGRSAAGADQAARRVVVLYNPIAGQRRRRRFEATLRHLRARGCGVEVLATARAGDAEAMAARIGAAEYDVLAVAGGDGTVNEVINGLRPDAPPLAVIPLGTANVFAREMALPLAPARLAAIIATGAPASVHLGVANGRRFVQMAGIGFDARVVEGVDPGAKRRFGRLAYAAEIARQWWRYRPARYRVAAHGEDLEASTVIVAKGRYYAGGFVVDPAADATRPELRVCLFLRAGRLPLLRYLAALGSGRLSRRRDVRMFAAREIEISADCGEGIQLDGDIRCPLPCRIGIEAAPILVLAGGRGA
jgi:YegS/Rv2252/BmrU family lipid kinase